MSRFFRGGLFGGKGGRGSAERPISITEVNPVVKRLLYGPGYLKLVDSAHPRISLKHRELIEEKYGEERASMQERRERTRFWNNFARVHSQLEHYENPLILHVQDYQNEQGRRVWDEEPNLVTVIHRAVEQVYRLSSSEPEDDKTAQMQPVWEHLANARQFGLDVFLKDGESRIPGLTTHNAKLLVYVVAPLHDTLDLLSKKDGQVLLDHQGMLQVLIEDTFEGKTVKLGNEAHVLTVEDVRFLSGVAHHENLYEEAEWVDLIHATDSDPVDEQILRGRAAFLLADTMAGSVVPVEGNPDAFTIDSTAFNHRFVDLCTRHLGAKIFRPEWIGYTIDALVTTLDALGETGLSISDADGRALQQVLIDGGFRAFQAQSLSSTGDEAKRQALIAGESHLRKVEDGHGLSLQSENSSDKIIGHMAGEALKGGENGERVIRSQYRQVFDGTYAEHVAALNGSGMPQLLDSRLLMREMIRRRTTPLRRLSEEFIARSFSREEGEKWEREYVASLGEAAEELYSQGMIMPVFRVDKSSVVDDPATMSRMMLPVLWESRVHKPKGMIQISGGAKGLNLTQFDSTEQVLDTLGKAVPAKNGLNAYRVAQLIYEAASENELAILTGGTQSGIMQAISAIHVYESTMQALPASDTRNYARTLGNNRGVGLIEAQELPILVHVVPENNTVITGNEGVEYEYNAPYGICPGTAGFVVSGVGFGGEGPGLDQAAEALGYVPAQEGIASELQAQTDRNSRIVAVINGGQLTLNEVENAVSGLSGKKDPKAKFLFMAGTERSADWLSSMIKDPTLTADQLFQLYPNDADLKGSKPEVGRKYRESLDRVANKLRALHQNDPSRIAIVDVRKPEAEYMLRGAIQGLLSTRV